MMGVLVAMLLNLPFSTIWAVDFEFSAPKGERPTPVCMVARELRSGREIRMRAPELMARATAPYPVDDESLVVAYYASAEMGNHLALGWPLPTRILDLFTEFRSLTNGAPIPAGNGLLGAMAYFGLDRMLASEKTEMRDLIISGGPFSAAQWDAILDYCATDVDALASLLPIMAPIVDLPRALLRGRYMAAVAKMEHTGIPIDTDTLSAMRRHWGAITEKLIERVDKDYGVYQGRTFKLNLFARYLADQGIAWPTTPTGRLALDDDTFKQMARLHPPLAALRELRATLSKLRLESLAVGKDGKNRCLLSPFRAVTSRNQPSTNKFIYGAARWIRRLIKPPPGMGLANIDYSQQEFGIGAALSGDQAMAAAYKSGDPYLSFAQQAGAAPDDATKQSHAAVRNLFKACALAVQYGMGEKSLALRIGQSEAKARELLRLHRSTYPVYWRWSDAAVDYAMLHGHIWTVFGWERQVTSNPNRRSLQNHPMQANGAEMLRLACCLTTERGVSVCAPVHDALVIEAPLADLDEAVRITQGAMAEASRAVLDGFELRSDANIVRYPDRYQDGDADLWNLVMEIIAELEA
jgi:DNA polymerase I